MLVLYSYTMLKVQQISAAWAGLWVTVGCNDTGAF